MKRQQWIPPAATVLAIWLARGEVAQSHDAFIEPGFPLAIWNDVSSEKVGPGLNILIGNIDADPELEFLFMGLEPADGQPIYAFNHDATPVTGWPVTNWQNAAYLTLAELDKSRPGNEVVGGFWTDGVDIVAMAGNGTTLPGWGTKKANYVETPGSAFDIDGDGIDEIFIDGQDLALHGFKADGTELLGWPSSGDTLLGSGCDGIISQERNTPAIADIDGDGVVEIMSATGSINSDSICLTAVHTNGFAAEGFPVEFSGLAHADTFLAVGDIEGDGDVEIMAVTAHPDIPDEPSRLRIVSNTGQIVKTIPLLGVAAFSSAPALADLDGDRVPEIIVQTNGGVDAIRGADGTSMPGWPFDPVGQMTESAPVVADVDGDLQPDIVFTGYLNNTAWAIDRFGRLLPGFPKMVNVGSEIDANQSIADVDLDGRNEILFYSYDWPGYASYRDRVWMYDLGGPRHGAIHWGQYGRDAKRTGHYTYPVIRNAPNADLRLTSPETQWNQVEDSATAHILTVTNLSASAVEAASITVFPPTGADITAASVDGTPCDVYLRHATCYVDGVGGGMSRSVSVTLLSANPGALTVRANVIGLTNDAVAANNKLVVSGTTTAAPPVSPGPDPIPDPDGGSDGGGGPLPASSLLALLLAGLLRKGTGFPLSRE